MFPFSVSKSWYEDYWYGDRPALGRGANPALMAGRLTTLFGLMIAGLRSLGHH